MHKPQDYEVLIGFCVATTLAQSLTRNTELRTGSNGINNQDSTRAYTRPVRQHLAVWNRFVPFNFDSQIAHYRLIKAQYVAISAWQKEAMTRWPWAQSLNAESRTNNVFRKKIRPETEKTRQISESSTFSWHKQRAGTFAFVRLANP